MKYANPKNRNMDVVDFLDSLPAEFEIVEPGMTQVRWPEWLTRERLHRASYDTVDGPACLTALAAIAPVEKKPVKRKVSLWRLGKNPELILHDSGNINEPTWIKQGYRKVGECEVTE